MNKFKFLMVASLWGACVIASGALAAPPSIQPGSWTLAILPDTQKYAESYPAIFNAQTQFLADYKNTLNLAFVLHEGDLVNKDLPAQWAVASNAFATLETAGVDYLLAVGNHEFGEDGKMVDRISLMSDYFPVSRLDNQPTFGNVYPSEPTLTHNSYSLFSAGGTDWLALSLEVGPRDEIVDWADSVLKAHPGRQAMIVTHAYMYSDDTRYDWATKGDTQLWNPHGFPIVYGLPPDALGTINDGEEIWQQLKDNQNLRFVFSGHVINDGTGYLASSADQGNVVHQILANYQGYTNGGNGYMRLLEFLPDGQTVHVRTYSPYLDASLTTADQDFVLTMSELPPKPQNLVWRMDFESENGAPVTHGQGFLETGYAQDGISETEYDPNGGARNTEGSSVSWYASYASPSVPAMPADMVATGQRGNFAFRAGNNIWRMAGQIPCTWGDSDKTHTIEGFFNNQEDLVTTLDGEYDSMKRTFVQTKRSSTDYRLSRLWVGMGVKSDPLGEGDDIPVLALMYATDPDPTVSFVSVLGDTEIVEGDWRHFALVLNTYDVGGTEMSDLTVYLDGIEEISVVGLTNLHLAGSKCFTLGEAWTTGNESGAESFNGYLDAIRVTNAALLPGEFLYVPIPGDATHDGQVDEDDAARLAEHWGATELISGLTWWEMGDFNGDKKVGAADAAILSANWGYGLGEGVSVPEPSMLGLLLVLAPMALLRRRPSVLNMLYRGY